MRVIRVVFLLHLITYFVLCPISNAEDEENVIESIRSSVEAILSVMKDESLAGSEKSSERRDKLKLIISARFDFKEMSKRSLARHWKKMTMEEQNEFIHIFSGLLQHTYINKIEAYTNERVTYDKGLIKRKGKYGIVKTSIFSKDIIIPIDYRLINRGNEWMVYDVQVEGVSVISNFRSQYNKILSRKSYAELIQQMKNKLEKITTPKL